MIRVVIDANVLFSGLISPHGPPGLILDAWIKGQFELCLSPDILQELAQVLRYSHIQARLEPGQSDRLLESLRMNSFWVEGTLVLDVLQRDPSDNIYLSCAVEAGADYLVSGNTAHFVEAETPYRGIEILSPRQFLELPGLSDL